MCFHCCKKMCRTLGPDDVSLRITHCGVCYADVMWSRNGLGDSKYPLVPGYIYEYFSNNSLAESEMMAI